VRDHRYTSPLQFAAAQTADFVQASCPQLSADSTILDVGCGDGLVAQELVKAGFNVMAIDSNEEAVSRSTAIGIDTVHSTLLDFENGQFDVLVVSRALHHMPPIVESVKKLDSLLKPSGILVIEDFGFELIDQPAAAWLIAKTREIKASGTVIEPRHKWLWNADNLSPDEACLLWMQHHWTKHQLLNSVEMRAALTAHTDVVSVTDNAYLYRYLCDFLATTADGAAKAENLMNEETKMLTQGELPAVGLRVLARKKT
jgi:SAM-dependent methyltransferase